mgnify:CR=1 FL=1
MKKNHKSGTVDNLMKTMLLVFLEDRGNRHSVPSLFFKAPLLWEQRHATAGGQTKRCLDHHSWTMKNDHDLRRSLSFAIVVLTLDFMYHREDNLLFGKACLKTVFTLLWNDQFFDVKRYVQIKMDAMRWLGKRGEETGRPINSSWKRQKHILRNVQGKSSQKWQEHIFSEKIEPFIFGLGHHVWTKQRGGNRQWMRWHAILNYRWRVGMKRANETA